MEEDFFETIEDIPNQETIQAIENARNGIGLSCAYTSVEDLFKALELED